MITAYHDLTNLKGVSSMKVSRDLHVGQATAWFMLQRIREAFMSDEPPIEFTWGGEYQVDEANFGGRERNRRNNNTFPTDRAEPT